MVRTVGTFVCEIEIASKSFSASVCRRVDAPFLGDQPSGKGIDSRRQAAILEVAE